MGSIRVISGKFRGRKLPVLDAEGLRPTTDRNKETLFNWLMPFIHNARCLDVFAGTGGLGIEALSRGAKSVTFIEKHRPAHEQLKANLNTLGVTADQAQQINADALSALSGLLHPFDVIFLDPPFGCNLLPDTLSQLQRAKLIAPGAVIYIESETQARFDVPSDWQMRKEKSAGQVLYRLFQHQE